MPAHITRLRIAGFKSFADPATIEILPGLTGVIGPNGCGKSNVVEALRWAMGESSARALRGGELDDLIFAGTGTRPSRNIAEVTLAVAEATGLGPSPFEAEPDLEISRRAERGCGSDYRINGRAMRARDVQTLFADLSSGARSSAMVSQNRVGQLIAAKPEERRTTLEEAAGITGLHVRRHDAELKLRQTEGNLARIEDQRLALEKQVELLTAQSVQAHAYREVASALRDAETMLEALGQARALQDVRRATDALAQAKSALSHAESTAEAATIADHDATRALPEARQTAEDARALLERLRAQMEIAQGAIDRADADAHAAFERARLAEADHASAQQRHDAAVQERDRLVTEQAAAQQRLAALPKARAALDLSLEKACAHTIEAARTAEDATLAARQAAETLARHQADLAAAQAAHQTCADEATRLSAALADLKNTTPDQPEIDRHIAAHEAAQTAYAQAQIARTTTEEAALEARLAQERAAQAHEAARTRAESLDVDIRQTTRRLDQLVAQIAQHESAIAQARANCPTDDALANAQDALATSIQAAEQAQLTQEKAASRLEQATADRLTAENIAQDASARAKRANDDLSACARALEQAETQRITTTANLAQAQNNQPHPAILQDARATLAAVEADLAALVSTLEAEEAQLPGLRHALAEAEQALRTHDAAIVRLKAQSDGIAATLSHDNTAADWQGLRAGDALDVPPDLIGGIAAALGDGLDAALPGATGEPRHEWAALDAHVPQALPGGAVALSSLLTPPPGLARALDAIGLVQDMQTGFALQPALKPGQCLITPQGALWRADGYVVRSAAPSAAAQRLAQQAQLADCSRQIAALQALGPDLANQAQVHQQAVQHSEERARMTAARRREAERRLAEARDQEGRARLAAEQAEGRLALARTQAEQAASRHAEAHSAYLDAQKHAAALPDPSMLAGQSQTARDLQDQASNALRNAREALNETRKHLDSARQSHDALEGQARASRETLALRGPTLAEAQSARNAAEQTLQEARSAREAAADPVAAAQVHERSQQARREAETLRDHTAAHEAETLTARDAAEALRRNTDERAIAGQARITALTPRLETLQTDLAHAEATLESCKAQAIGLPDPEQCAQAAQEARERALSAREDENALRAEQATRTAEEAQLTQSLEGLTRQIAEIEPRLTQAMDDLHTLAARMTDLREIAISQADHPAALKAAHIARTRDLDEAQVRSATADARAQACTQAQEAAIVARREADAALASKRAELGAAIERAKQAQDAMTRLVGEDATPRTIPDIPDLSDASESQLRRKITKLTRERDDMGPVNLRAELEHEAAKNEFELLSRECSEILTAIERLRGSISQLNKEGRARLSAVFAEVDRHFQSLFSRMFGGGRAHLALIGSDDPLEAGLEIYAQPPGKRLSALSLLSGGEQALTALSLIFATHLCNPAPICVLDEVDAPLDDANVERFCALLADMAQSCGTRFLVVTHHQTTMAHMDRLYGVTMQERGVSRVLSVDLSRAIAMVENP